MVHLNLCYPSLESLNNLVNPTSDKRGRYEYGRSKRKQQKEKNSNSNDKRKKVYNRVPLLSLQK